MIDAGSALSGADGRRHSMNILLIASAFNSLSQRVFAELTDRGHTVRIELASADTPLEETVPRHDPDLIVAPILKTAIPRQVWSSYTCLIVHPGPVGDRGPSSLDWAIHEGATLWGVTVLQAVEEMDAGDVWATVQCPLPPVGKSDLYRNEVSDAAVAAVLLAVDRFASGAFTPRPQSPRQEQDDVTPPRGGIPRPLESTLTGTAGAARTRPFLRQGVRRVDWASDPTEAVVRKLRAADSQPGVLDEFLGGEWFLHGGCGEDTLRGRPGEFLATRAGALCRATVDGAVWIPELRPRRQAGGPMTFKLPAVLALGDRLPGLPEAPVLLELPAHRRTWTDIRYREEGQAGFLSFSFPGGAMSTRQCRRLLSAYREACTRPTDVLVIGASRDFFSNGIHLNVIEAADDPAEESWQNITAMDDLAEAILTTTDRLTIAAISGNAAAGGAMLAFAADEVWCRSGAVLNPHYRLMGLYGSEYWTYTLPRKAGRAQAELLTRRALPITAAHAHSIGLVDRLVHSTPEAFAATTNQLALRLSSTSSIQQRIGAKKAVREHDEAVKPLHEYREEELSRMRGTFFDPNASYHALRTAFVRKQEPPAASTRTDSVG
jgi:putative two-component system hydrogenase maturation factor HypX/HoxX